MRLMYLDRFANKYVKDKEIIAPPERYIEVTDNKSLDTYFETYCDKGLSVTVQYTRKDWDEGRINQKRCEVADIHKGVGLRIEAKNLRAWSIPRNEFDRIAKHAGFTFGKDEDI